MSFAFSNTEKLPAVSVNGCEFLPCGLKWSQENKLEWLSKCSSRHKGSGRVSREGWYKKEAMRVTKRGRKVLSRMSKKGIYIRYEKLWWQMRLTTNWGKGHIPQEIRLADFLSGKPSSAQIKVQTGCRLMKAELALTPDSHWWHRLSLIGVQGNLCSNLRALYLKSLLSVFLLFTTWHAYFFSSSNNHFIQHASKPFWELPTSCSVWVDFKVVNG